MGSGCELASFVHGCGWYEMGEVEGGFVVEVEPELLVGTVRVVMVVCQQSEGPFQGNTKKTWLEERRDDLELRREE